MKLDECNVKNMSFTWQVFNYCVFLGGRPESFTSFLMLCLSRRGKNGQLMSLKQLNLRIVSFTWQVSQ